MIINDYVTKLQQPNVDYSSKMTLTILNSPKHINQLYIDDYYKLKENYKKLDKETFLDYLENNKEFLHYENIDMKGIEVIVLDNDSSPNKNFLTIKYPNWIHSILEFSNIGFNKTHNQALVYYGFYSGPNVGGGLYIIFEKKGRKWKRKKVIPAWAA